MADIEFPITKKKFVNRLMIFLLGLLLIFGSSRLNAVARSLSLVQGWNWVSFNVLPNDLSLDGVFTDVLGQVEQVRTQTQSAIRQNGNWFGDLPDMSGIGLGLMYKIRVSQDCTFTIAGATIPVGRPIQMIPGWNWIAYFPVSVQSPQQALANIEPYLLQAKSQSESVIHTGGQWLGDLDQMSPGRGYLILVDTPVSLIYPLVNDGPGYFVAVNGDNSGPGTIEQPFLTIQHALDLAQAGDTVFVRAGVYQELVSFPRSGAPGTPVTLKSYGGESVTLNGDGLGGSEGTPGIVKISDKSHITVQGLTLTGLTGRNGNFPSGIWVRGTCTNIVIRGNVVHGIAAQNGGNNSGAHGIAVYGTNPAPSENILIEGNEAYGLVLGWSEAVVINGNVRYFELRNNTVHDVNNIAFDFIGFESDVCPSCTNEDLVDEPNVNRVRNGLAAGNIAYNVSSYGNPAYGDEKSAGGFYVDGGACLIIEGNRAHHCDIGVELASEWYGKSTREVIVRNNFIYKNDVTGIAIGGYSSGTGSGGGQALDCRVINNTIVDCSLDGWADAAILLQNRNINNIFKNNILMATQGHSCAADYGQHNTGNVFDYNIYAVGGLDGVSGGAHSLFVDPGLADVLNDDFHLLMNSPAIDAGENLPDAIAGLLDIDGDPRKNNGIDIGADEYHD